MITNIQKAFTQAVKELTWMDAYTKKATIRKINAIGVSIGVPSWIADKEELESMYNVCKKYVYIYKYKNSDLFDLNCSLGYKFCLNITVIFKLCGNMF